MNDDNNYLEQARARAARRKSPLNLLLPLLMLPSWIFLSWWHLRIVSGLLLGPECMVTALPCSPAGPRAGLMVLGAFIPVLAPTMIAINGFLWLLLPVRRVFDREAQGVPGATFRESQRALAKAALVLFVVCEPLLLLSLKWPF